jgi:hypothetical protein
MNTLECLLVYFNRLFKGTHEEKQIACVIGYSCGEGGDIYSIAFVLIQSDGSHKVVEEAVCDLTIQGAASQIYRRVMQEQKLDE